MGDQFDVACGGFAELVAAGRFRDAERVAAVTMRNWQRVRASDPDWAERYAGLGPR
jgi:hypothetical protein